MRISYVNVGRVGTLAYNSIIWRSIRLFNSLPMYLRSIPRVQFLDSRPNLISSKEAWRSSLPARI